MPTNLCPKCRERERHGKQSYCHPCVLAYQRERDANHPRQRTGKPCSRCKKAMCQPSHTYCRDCYNEIQRGYYLRDHPTRIPRDVRAATCARCRIAPKIRGQMYCRPCRVILRRDYMKTYRHSDQERRKMDIRFLTNYAIKCGLLARRPCEQCGAPQTQAHHPDYGKPLEVRWLCKVCHGREHGKSTL